MRSNQTVKVKKNKSRIRIETRKKEPSLNGNSDL